MNAKVLLVETMRRMNANATMNSRESLCAVDETRTDFPLPGTPLIHRMLLLIDSLHVWNCLL
jgi:hypothetical protein